ncbi:MAG: DNA cytosine methyltransferase, partial [Paramuribaculum sp.]|nr:DNA cytosine methyltransferase [Paramuribaculum sp.]
YKAGFDIIGGLDIWEPAIKTFQLNHPDAKTYKGDIRDFNAADIRKDLKLDKGELDCMVGGPPCQGFSKNVPSVYRFLEDSRNQLYKDYIRFVDEFLPKIVVIENVAEIYNAFNGEIRRQIVLHLEELGYMVAVKVLFAPDYGVPQRRSRCFFLATRNGKKPYFPEPTHQKANAESLFSINKTYVSAWDAICDLPELENGEGALVMEYDKPAVNDYQRFMRRDSGLLHDHITRELKGVQLERMRSLSAGQGIKDLPPEIRPKGGYSGAYGRLDFDNVAQTITRWCFHPGSGRYGHPKNARLITIREAARLQCFTDDFVFSGTYIEKAAQIGNAVPSLIMYTMANVIKDLLGNNKSFQQHKLFSSSLNSLCIKSIK